MKKSNKKEIMKDKNMTKENKEKIELKENPQKVYKPLNVNNFNMLPGNPQGLPDESFLKDTLVFIDANFLSKLSKHFGSGKYLIYDLINFSENLSKKQKLICKKIFYYTSPPFQSSVPTFDEGKRKDGYDKFLNKLRKRGVIVREGRCQRLKFEKDFVYKQKAVDILLAMDLMKILLDYPEIKRIILISTDSDFVPVIKNLQANGIKTILYTYYEKMRDTPFSRSNYLIKSVHKYVLLTKEDFTSCPLNKEEKENENSPFEKSPGAKEK